MGCEKCNGLGMVPVKRGGTQYMTDCECKREILLHHMIERAGLPNRYKSVTLECFGLAKASDSVKMMHRAALEYVKSYPLDTSRGLLLTGSVGTGKTHIAIGILRALAWQYSVKPYFTDFRELLKRLQETFSKKGAGRDDVLRPIKNAQVVVIDEIAAERSTDWTFDVAEEIINWRYNNAMATIFTSNLPNRPAGWTPERTATRSYTSQAADAMRGETLGDRLGARMFSRLQEMAVSIEVTGEDYRTKGSRP